MSTAILTAPATGFPASPPILTRCSLTGGESVLSDAIFNLRQRMMKQDDVYRVLELAERADGKFLYLIQTPFSTFPKFVIGITDTGLEDVTIMHKCGMEWNACAQWERIRYASKKAVETLNPSTDLPR